MLTIRPEQIKVFAEQRMLDWLEQELRRWDGELWQTRQEEAGSFAAESIRSGREQGLRLAEDLLAWGQIGLLLGVNFHRDKGDPLVGEFLDDWDPDTGAKARRLLEGALVRAGRESGRER